MLLPSKGPLLSWAWQRPCRPNPAGPPHPQARRIQRKAAEQGVGEAAEPEQPERQSLGVLGGRRPAAASGRAAGLLGGAAGFKRKAAAAVSGDAENGNAGGGGGLDIFVDDEFAGGAPAASAPAAFLQPGRCAGWRCACVHGLPCMQLQVQRLQCAAGPLAPHKPDLGAPPPPTGPQVRGRRRGRLDQADGL